METADQDTEIVQELSRLVDDPIFLWCDVWTMFDDCPCTQIVTDSIVEEQLRK